MLRIIYRQTGNSTTAMHARHLSKNRRVVPKKQNRVKTDMAPLPYAEEIEIKIFMDAVHSGKRVLSWTILEFSKFYMQADSLIKPYIQTDETALFFWNDFWHPRRPPFRFGSCHSITLRQAELDFGYGFHHHRRHFDLHRLGYSKRTAVIASRTIPHYF